MPPTPDRGDFLFKPATPEQHEAVRAFKTSDILFLTGPAGSGKTHVAVALATQHVLSGAVDRIILTRPLVTVAGEEMGFLPGKVEQKMHPWLLPIHDVLRRMTFAKPDQWVKEHCEVCPLGFMRGRTFDRCVAILDEAQNCKFEQIKLFLTRIGHKGKLILSGDPEQSDIPVQARDLSHCISMLRGVVGISHVDLDGDVNPRHPIISRILDNL